MHITGSKNHLWGQKASKRKKIHSREDYSIRNPQQNQHRISTANPAKKENSQQRRLKHQKSTAKSAQNFYSKTQRRKRIHSREDYHIKNLQAKSSDNFYSKTSEENRIYSIKNLQHWKSQQNKHKISTINKKRQKGNHFTVAENKEK